MSDMTHLLFGHSLAADDKPGSTGRQTLRETIRELTAAAQFCLGLVASITVGGLVVAGVATIDPLGLFAEDAAVTSLDPISERAYADAVAAGLTHDDDAATPADASTALEAGAR